MNTNGKKNNDIFEFMNKNINEVFVKNKKFLNMFGEIMTCLLNQCMIKIVPKS